VYPQPLCEAILKGFREQLLEDGRVELNLFAKFEDNALEEECAAAREPLVELLATKRKASHGLAPSATVFKDAITGQTLREDMVRAARKEELDYFAAKKVWAKATRHEAFVGQGKPPITVKWIDTNKGDDQSPNYRSRLVAREIRRPGEQSIFAPTPPLEALRSVLSMAATDLPNQRKHVRSKNDELRTQVSVIDIKRAYFNAKADDERPTFVELPEEDPDHKKGMCARLLVHMYGTRAAGEGWHAEYSDFLVSLGFKKGDASPCIFSHPERRVVSSV